MAVLLSANESYPVLQPTVGHRILNFRCNKQSFLLSYNLNRVIVNRVANLTNLYHYCHCYTYRVLLAVFYYVLISTFTSTIIIPSLFYCCKISHYIKIIQCV